MLVSPKTQQQKEGSRDTKNEVWSNSKVLLLQYHSHLPHIPDGQKIQTVVGPVSYLMFGSLYPENHQGDTHRDF